MGNAKLRTKFLFASAPITALLTCAVLLTVRQRVELRVREQIAQELDNSVVTFRAMQQQREATLERSAALLAALPPLMAVMTSGDRATIQDASETFWNLSGSQLFVLAEPDGQIAALHTTAQGLSARDAAASLAATLRAGQTRDWWFSGGHLFQVFLQPITFGSTEGATAIGLLAVGFEVDPSVAADVARVASGQVAFRYGNDLVVTTLPPLDRTALLEWVDRSGQAAGPRTFRLGNEEFLATTVGLSEPGMPPVGLTVLKSYDQATLFLRDLNRWIVGVGIAAVLAGAILVFLASTTFTRPLEELARGVRALESGDFAYPLPEKGSEEVMHLTAAFEGMRSRLGETQQQLIGAERMATIGRMASTISHDLRHPLTAIMAYAEFLAEPKISEAQRRDFFQEIRIAVNRMTDDLNSLLGFSKQSETIRPVHTQVAELIERAVQTARMMPEFAAITMEIDVPDDCVAWLDPGKVERVILNLLYNACEAVSPETGEVHIEAHLLNDNLELRISDNGSGVPEAIRERLFQPFVSHGKEKGIGLGLAVVQKLVHDHGGEVSLEHTGPEGTTFRLALPAAQPIQSVA